MSQVDTDRERRIEETAGTETGVTSTGQETANSPRLRWSILLLVAASAFSPLMSWANATERPSTSIIFVLATSYALVGVGVWWLFVRFGLDPAGSACAIALFLLVVTNTGEAVMYERIEREWLLFGSGAVAALLYRLRRLAVWPAIMSWLTLFLLLYPTTLVVVNRFLPAEPQIDVSSQFEISDMAEKPDILVVVFDAYGGVDSLTTTFGFDNREVLIALESRGFDAPGEVLANYGRTQLSISSVLQMDYVATQTTLADADLEGLLSILGGDSKLSRGLQAQGYRYVHVESGWLGTRCGPTVDLCVGAPWPDETLYDAMDRTVMVGLPGLERGRAYTFGALRAARWFDEGLPQLLSDGQPDLIFAHLLIPHPPLFLDGGCSPDIATGVDGWVIGHPGKSREEIEFARVRYLQQVECANTIILQLAGHLSSDDVAIIMGDHGPDSQSQHYAAQEDWTEAQRTERYSAFLATKVPGCDMGDIESLVNVGRRMLTCLTGDSFPDLPTRQFLVEDGLEGDPVTELAVASRP